MLREFGIDMNDPSNLARMMDDAHRVLHTNSYYAYVVARARSASNPSEMRKVLREIKQLLESLRTRNDSRRHFPPAKRR
jgi:hypothetical protein